MNPNAAGGHRRIAYRSQRIGVKQQAPNWRGREINLEMEGGLRSTIWRRVLEFGELGTNKVRSNIGVVPSIFFCRNQAPKFKKLARRDCRRWRREILEWHISSRGAKTLGCSLTPLLKKSQNSLKAFSPSFV